MNARMNECMKAGGRERPQLEDKSSNQVRHDGVAYRVAAAETERTEYL